MWETITYRKNKGAKKERGRRIPVRESSLNLSYVHDTVISSFHIQGDYLYISICFGFCQSLYVYINSEKKRTKKTTKKKTNQQSQREKKTETKNKRAKNYEKRKC